MKTENIIPHISKINTKFEIYENNAGGLVMFWQDKALEWHVVSEWRAESMVEDFEKLVSGRAAYIYEDDADDYGDISDADIRAAQGSIIVSNAFISENPCLAGEELIAGVAGIVNFDAALESCETVAEVKALFSNGALAETISEWRRESAWNKSVGRECLKYDRAVIVKLASCDDLNQVSPLELAEVVSDCLQGVSAVNCGEIDTDKGERFYIAVEYYRGGIQWDNDIASDVADLVEEICGNLALEEETNSDCTFERIYKKA